jgi:pimeloyl-ACP methyl ester carboxylesterase
MIVQGSVNAILVLQLLLGVSNAWLIPRRRTRCYNDPPIGCFPVSHPHGNTAGIAPQSPASINVRFYFYQNSQAGGLFNIHGADQVLASTYNSSAKTVLIIHGYFENGYTSWIHGLGDELLRKDSHMNVIVMHWGGGSSNIIYYRSVANGRVAGAIAALLLQKLADLGGDLSSFHVVGFSLGAHVAGHVGSRLRGIGRITGLDPARPGFERAAPEARLDPTDANLVDVIHTDAANDVGVGVFQPLGTVDFYPNGGINQPGCPVTVMDRVSAVVSSFDFTGDSVRFAVGCSHSRATRLFASSINNCSFTSTRCSSTSQVQGGACSPCGEGGCPDMGYNLDSAGGSHLTGLYRTHTTSSAPYC